MRAAASSAHYPRIRAIYAADNAFAELAPIDRKRERLLRVLQLVNEFFAWVESMEPMTPGRTLAARALGYAKNQAAATRWSSSTKASSRHCCVDSICRPIRHHERKDECIDDSCGLTICAFANCECVTTAAQDNATALASIDEAIAELDRVRHERDEYKKAYGIAMLALERLRRHSLARKPIASTARSSRSPSARSRSDSQSSRKSRPMSRALRRLRLYPRRRRSRNGRRRLQDLDLPEERIVIPVPGLPEGAVHVGDDVSYRLGHRRASDVRIVVVRPRYVVPTSPDKAEEACTETTIINAEAPDELVPRGMLSVDVCAKILVDKFCDHLPFHRQEQRFARKGIQCRRPSRTAQPASW